MTKIKLCLQKLQEINEQDYNIGLAQDIAEAEQELEELETQCCYCIYTQGDDYDD